MRTDLYSLPGAVPMRVRLCVSHIHEPAHRIYNAFSSFADERVCVCVCKCRLYYMVMRTRARSAYHKLYINAFNIIHKTKQHTHTTHRSGGPTICTQTGGGGGGGGLTYGHSKPHSAAHTSRRRRRRRPKCATRLF